MKSFVIENQKDNLSVKKVKEHTCEDNFFGSPWNCHFASAFKVMSHIKASFYSL